MSMTYVVLLIFGIGTALRGAYAVAVQDVTDEEERMTGRHAICYGVVLVVLGLAICSHAVFEWPWVTAIVRWLHAS